MKYNLSVIYLLSKNVKENRYMSITVEQAKIKYNLKGEKYDAAETWCQLSFLPLPEILIRETKNMVYWCGITEFSKLSEGFIGKFKVFYDGFCWNHISAFQKLSENFIRKFKNKVNWYDISEYQKLSEDFIREFKYYVDWDIISKYQPLSEDFIREFQDEVDWYNISRHQVVSKEFLAEFGRKLYNNSDKPESYWKEQVQKTGLYECHEDYFYAYKGIRSNRYSAFNFQYQYLPGKTYECFSDYSDDENSFGLSAWTEEEAENYCNELVVKVKVYYKDVTAVVHDDGKIRCKRLTVLE